MMTAVRRAAFLGCVLKVLVLITTLAGICIAAAPFSSSAADYSFTNPSTMALPFAAEGANPYPSSSAA